MDLRLYLFLKKISASELARRMDYSQATINGVVRGTYKPTKKICRAIEHATGGHVTREDLEGKREEYVLEDLKSEEKIDTFQGWE